MKKDNFKTIIILHLLLMLYSLSGVCSKMAGRAGFLSVSFVLWYGTMMLIMVFYAIGWQQMLKRLPLSVAFANKAVTLVWSLFFGVLFFREQLKWNQIAGCLLAVIGVVIYVMPTREENGNDA